MNMANLFMGNMSLEMVSLSKTWPDQPEPIQPGQTDPTKDPTIDPTQSIQTVRLDPLDLNRLTSTESFDRTRRTE